MSQPPDQIFCLNCGYPNRIHARFCSYCGKLINQVQDTPPPVSPQPLYSTPAAPRTRSRRNLVVLGIALLLLALAFGGYSIYRASAESEYAAGLAAQQAGNCAEANAHFQRLLAVYSSLVSPEVTQLQTSGSECMLLVEAATQAQSGNYEQAAQKYETFIKNYPKSVQQTAAAAALNQIYLQWGQ